jgi:hypothetical protein
MTKAAPVNSANALPAVLGEISGPTTGTAKANPEIPTRSIIIPAIFVIFVPAMS